MGLSWKSRVISVLILIAVGGLTTLSPLVMLAAILLVLVGIHIFMSDENVSDGSSSSIGTAPGPNTVSVPPSSTVEQDQDQPWPHHPTPAATSSGTLPYPDASEPFRDPTEIDRRVKSEWFPGPDSHMDKQQQDIMTHRMARRNQEWASTRIWTKGDAEKYERARKLRERDIALSLKPDPFMIVEAGPEDDRVNGRAPFLDTYGNHHLWHRQTYQYGMRGTGNLADGLTSNQAIITSAGPSRPRPTAVPEMVVDEEDMGQLDTGDDFIDNFIDEL